MSGYVDIHAHVLPGIDDGPEDLEGSLAMARAASEAGIWTLAATPHLRSDFPNVHIHELAERCAEVSQAIEREQIPVRLIGGAEVSLIWALDADDEELKLASYRQAGSDLLVETPLTGVIGLQQHLYELRLRGMRVTLAHPERSAEFQRDPGKAEALVDQGIMLQVNAGSLVAGERSSSVRRLAEHLCTSGLATVLASDAHRGTDWRPVTKLARGVEAVAELVGPERAEWMARDAPAAIVAGSALPSAPALAVKRRSRRLFGRR